MKRQKRNTGNTPTADLPEHAASHAFGCGNPLAFSGVKEGEAVLDLGSGAGCKIQSGYALLPLTANGVSRGR